jgi:hypothetical protein
LTIVVNEVVAKAAAGEPDWVELYNLGSEDADLGGWSIADDSDHSYVFAPGKIVGAGEYLLVDANEFGFGLGSDDQVTLLQPDGSEADLADWEDGAAPLGTSWGRIPNGTGEFKTLGTPTPGAENIDTPPPSCGDGSCNGKETCVSCEDDCSACPPPTLVINEIVAKGADDNPDWVELYNPDPEEVDISGWTIEDDGGGKYLLPEGTTLGGGEYLVVNDALLGFGLGSDDAVLLSDAEGELVDVADWEDGDAPVGKSWGRIPNGTGDFKTLSTPTSAAANIDNTVAPPPTAVVINELVAKAADDGDDWLELYNSGESEVDLSGWTVGDAGGDSYALVDGTVLAAGAYLVLEKSAFDFGLGKADSLTLKNLEGTWVDATSWVDGDAPKGSSWGRFPDGTGSFQTLTSPTKGAENVVAGR